MDGLYADEQQPCEHTRPVAFFSAFPSRNSSIRELRIIPVFPFPFSSTEVCSLMGTKRKQY